MSYNSLRFKSVEKYDKIPDEHILEIGEPVFKESINMWRISVKLSADYGPKKANRVFYFTAKSSQRGQWIYDLLISKKNKVKLRGIEEEYKARKVQSHKIVQLIEEKGLVILNRYEKAKEGLKRTDTKRAQQWWSWYKKR